ncbi:2-aminoethylphosphonate--pyruvate transaminase [Kyrpidia spormannii]|uniref:2-aminoethylphosphonate--pyruvate transaminase n=1 Tax=Kyrpidia spormannii TaxID=2055160 RepID=A0A2K8N5L0_9BACL|nr:2-aminoethylphosphonate--pyruvate transaminase [Kyrpidia spormannii]ATY84616.1 2-aminoethylphosphonate--pyruvate transaminase [Kyrpidia spormannii]
MDISDDNPYLLLTPGPVSTSPGVRRAMLRDWCTWDDDYKELVQDVRRRLTWLAGDEDGAYTTVLLQGSGTFAVEATIGTAIPPGGKLLILENGAYGRRMARICRVLRIPAAIVSGSEVLPCDLEQAERVLRRDPAITHLAMVHVETTTGVINPLKEFADLVRTYGKISIVDGMSSFGGIEIDISGMGIDFFISSANKCLQGVPGLGFVIARRDELAECRGRARSLSLDLYDQWREMEEGRGKWRFTSPTHAVRALHQALQELAEEGGVPARNRRYRENQRVLVEGMERLGFRILVPRAFQSPVITTFLYPDDRDFSFPDMYMFLKRAGFVIYPGKLTDVDTFRIGTIGTVTPEDIQALLEALRHFQSVRLRNSAYRP